MKKFVLAVAVYICSWGSVSAAPEMAPAKMASAKVESILAGKHRTAANIERDKYRHPLETLKFMEVSPNMSVVEIWPGGGWYTEILAPLLRDEGVFYAAHFPQTTTVEYFANSRKRFLQKMSSNPKVYDKVKVTDFFPPSGTVTVPKNSVDRVLTFRNVHNWMNRDYDKAAFAEFYMMLKPGGILGVVEHRARPGTDKEAMIKSGYVTEEYVIKQAKAAGFKLEARSEINANKADNTSHPKGVWTLPPTLRLGDKDRGKYLAIGESDRMTLKFRKPK